jgi:poly-gamma-glutamate capsule biosynthesis protein CapA/YwtB (metallophosphatase superfamily)
VGLLGSVGALCLAAAWLVLGGAGAASGPTRAADGPDSEDAAAARQLPPGAKVTITAVGDIAMGLNGALPRGGAAGLFGGMRDELAGDVVLGNLEQALTDAGSSKCGSSAASSPCFAFQAPPAYAAGLREAGFTVLNLANNHSYDFGRAGIDETVAALRDAELAHTGLPGKIARLRAGPVRVAVVGFAPYDVVQNMLDIPAARALVRRADRWADIVVVTMHGGTEGVGADRVPRGPETYLGEQRGDPRAFAHAVVDAGADLVAGHGPHVLRGMEWYRRRLIAYSLGNFAGHKTFNVSGRGAVSGILTVTLRGDGTLAQGRLAPIRLVEDGAPVPDAAEAAHGVVRELSRADFGRRAVDVSPVGELLPPR